MAGRYPGATYDLAVLRMALASMASKVAGIYDELPRTSATASTVAAWCRDANDLMFLTETVERMLCAVETQPEERSA